MHRNVKEADCGKETEVKENRNLPDGFELVEEDTFWPEGRWSFHRGNLVWSRIAGWQKYYEAKRKETQFKTAEEAMVAWESLKHSFTP
jgi:hypothetical protein